MYAFSCLILACCSVVLHAASYKMLWTLRIIVIWAGTAADKALSLHKIKGTVELVVELNR